MKIISEILMLAPAITFVGMLLLVKRFKSLAGYMITTVLAMLAAAVLAAIGICISLGKI